MANNDPSAATTAALMERYAAVFQNHDPSALPGIIAENCVVETNNPGPEGQRLVGRDACVALWTGIATAPGTRFELEETYVMGDRAIIRWRFFSGEKLLTRGVNLMKVRDAQIVESMGYVKG